MEITIKLFVCFGIPIIGIFLYHKIFSALEDNTVFHIGLVNTINYLGWFAVLSTTFFFGGLSGLTILGFSYLVCIAPILSIGFTYWILLHKNELVQYRYALSTSIIYIASIFTLLAGILLFSKS